MFNYQYLYIMKWFPENHQYFMMLREHTFNIIVNPTNIENIIERVRPAIENYEAKVI